MDSLAHDYAAGLFKRQEPPCLSLYQPTHRHYPMNQQDPIRFGNLVKSIERSLRQKYTGREVQLLLNPFQRLADDHQFWTHTQDGLAVLAARNLFRVYRLQRPVPELVVVADSFHFKPLIRILQSADRYQLLGLNRLEVKLIEGNRDALDEIELAPEVPRTLTDALGEQLTDPHLTVASYGKGAAGPAMHHGHGSRKDELGIDTERFFRAVDRAVFEHHSRPSGLPLILAALPEYHTLFRNVSQNSFLMEEAIDVHPDSLTPDELVKRAWQAVEPRYLGRLARLVDDYHAARTAGLASDNLGPIAEAAAAGRVAKLLLEAERCIPGRIDDASGRIEPGELAHPEIDDLLDDLGELVLGKGGQIVIFPPERMPTQSGIAAIYRF